MSVVEVLPVAIFKIDSEIFMLIAYAVSCIESNRFRNHCFFRQNSHF